MSHVELTALFDYWAAELDAGDEAALEEHVFACDSCAHRLEATGALVRAIPRLIARRGGVNLFITRGLVERMERGGLVLRHYKVQLGDVVNCTIGREEDMLVTWFQGSFRAHEPVRVEFVVDGKLIDSYDDVPVDQAHDEIIFTLRGDVARRLPDNTLVIRVFGSDGLLGETIFQHTAFRL